MAIEPPRRSIEASQVEAERSRLDAALARADVRDVGRPPSLGSG